MGQGQEATDVLFLYGARGAWRVRGEASSSYPLSSFPVPYCMRTTGICVTRRVSTDTPWHQSPPCCTCAGTSLSTWLWHVLVCSFQCFFLCRLDGEGGSAVLVVDAAGFESHVTQGSWMVLLSGVCSCGSISRSCLEDAAAVQVLHTCRPDCAPRPCLYTYMNGSWRNVAKHCSEVLR